MVIRSRESKIVLLHAVDVSALAPENIDAFHEMASNWNKMDFCEYEYVMLVSRLHSSHQFSGFEEQPKNVWTRSIIVGITQVAKPNNQAQCFKVRANPTQRDS